MLSHKNCRGQHKARSFSGCGHLVKVEYRKYGLCPSCFSDFLNTEDGKPLLSNSILRGRQKIREEVQTSLKTQKTALKSNVTNWKRELQDLTQKIARQIDKDLLCPVRPKVGQQRHGGHLWSKGGHAECRFNLHNLHRQSAQSNCWQNDEAAFRDAIEKEYGSDYIEFVRGLVGQPIPKLTNLEYQQIYYKARKISNELTKENKTYSIEERIELRNICNIELGIYTTEQSIFKRQ